MTHQFSLGWREWVCLPELKLCPIKAKVDTGAKTSCLHAFDLKTSQRDGQAWVNFLMHPNQNDSETIVSCEAKIIDERIVSDSGGHQELRPVIESMITVGQQRWPLEITLTNRDTMRFRMLLGRTGIPENYIVHPHQSYLQGQPDLK